MLCPKLRRRLRFLALGLAAAFLLVWGGILVLAPTSWARDRIVKRLSEETGRIVHLDRVRVGLWGGVRLENLTISEPDRKDDPWLKVGRLTIDVNACHLLLGRCEPTKIRAENLVARIERKADGSFEFGDLFRAGPKKDGVSDSGGSDENDLDRVAFRIIDGKVLVVDAPSGSRVEFENLQGYGAWQHETAEITELKGNLEGGTFAMAAQLQRGPGCPGFDTELRIEQAAIGQNTRLLAYLVPIACGSAHALDGKLDLALYLRGQGDTAAMLRQTVTGQAAVRVDPISLDGSRLIDELDGLVDLPKAARVGSLVGELQIEHGRISTKGLRLNLGETPLVLSGWTDLDGRVDYRLQTELLSRRVSGEAGGLLAELPEIVGDLFETRLTGTLDHLDLTVDGVPLDKNARGADGRPLNEKARLKLLGRRLRDRLLR
jgi:hypothetical protein